MTATVEMSPAELARILSERIRWEMELGTVGYEKGAVVRLSSGGEPAPSVTVSPKNGVSPSGGTASHVSTETPQPRAPSLKSEAPTEASLVSEPVTTPTVSTSPVVPSVDPLAALEALRRAVGDCTRCELHRGRNHLVFGEGDPKARLVFVGEGPGREEDQEGRPFVGAAGKLLDRIIEAMGLHRNQVYICNVVKCRPPNNRAPEEAETNICGQFMRRQLSVIGPEVVVALGGTAASYLLGGHSPISRVRGRFHEVENLRIMPTYHPAYLLRNPGEKRAVWNDMQTVMQALGLEKK